MNSYQIFMDELNKILLESNSINELLQKIKTSKIIDLEKDIDIICSEIKVDEEFSLDEFLEELINEGKIDLIKNNIEAIGIKNIFRFTNATENLQLTEFIEKNFRKLLEVAYEREYISLIDIKSFIKDNQLSKEVIEGIPIMIKNMNPFERADLIDIINNKNSMNIEDFLSDLLYIPTNDKALDGIDNVLLKLANIENLDKTKLLKEVNNNFEKLITSFNSKYTYKIISFLDTIKRIQDSVPKESEEANNLTDEINNQISNKFEWIIKNNYYNIDLINSLRQFNIDNSKFLQIQDDIIEQLSGANLVKYIQSTKGNEGFHKNWDFSELTIELFKDTQEVRDDEVVQVTISKLMEELCEHENLGISDIEYAGSGYFNFNIKIGNYILKIGDNIYERGSDEIPNDKRILKPILRQVNNKRNKAARVFLEIQNFVDANWYEGLSDEEIEEQLYKIYKELRDRKIRWTDIKQENVGRLLKPNKENFKIETLNDKGKVEKTEIKSDNYAIGFYGKKPDEILGPGELVVIDIDYIYKEDEDFGIPNGTYYEEFEERYQLEKTQEFVDKIKNISTNEERIQYIKTLPDDIIMGLLCRVEEICIETQENNKSKTTQTDLFKFSLIDNLSEENLFQVLYESDDRVIVDFIQNTNQSDNMKIQLIDLVEIFSYQLLIANQIENEKLKTRTMSDLGVSKTFFEMEQGKYELYSDKDLIDNPIGLSSDLTFGIEIEGTNLDYAEVLKQIRNLPGKLQSWIWKGDYTIVEGIRRNNDINFGLEVVSPVLNDNKKSVQQIYTICNMLKDLTTEINPKCGGHIHYGIDYFETPKQLYNLIEIYGNCEEIFSLIGNEEGVLPRDSLNRFAESTYKKVKNANIDVERFSGIREFIEELKKIQYGKNYDVNISDHNTVEFRTPNSSIEPEVWLENIKLYGKLMEVSKGLEEGTLSNYNKKRDLFSKLATETDIYKKCNLLLELLFDNEMDREIFKERFTVNRNMQFQMKELREIYLVEENNISRNNHIEKEKIL